MTLRQTSTEFRIQTRADSFTDITDELAAWVAAQGMQAGLLTLFVRHSTASLVIQENADPDVLRDLMDAYRRLAPADAGWRHDTEGPDDMPGHVKAALSPVSLSIPIVDGRMALGTWQAVYLAEWRARPHTRSVAAHLIGE